MTDLSKIGDRDALKSRPGDEPHWMRLQEGRYLGYRPTRKKEGRGTWFARAFDVDSGKYSRKALGAYSDITNKEVFAQAKKDAEAFADIVASGGAVRRKVETVGDACRVYAETHTDAEGRLKRLVYSDPIERVKLDKLRRHHVEEWRARVEALPALVSRSKKGEKRTRDRAPSTVNRDLVPLRAALSKFLAPGAPNSPSAWQEVLKPIENANKQRTLYLDIEQRRQIMAVIEDEGAPFVRAIGMLPLRPGAMAHLSAGDFDKRTRELTIGKDKTGKPRRIIMPDAVSAFLAEQMKNKLPAAPLFMRAGGLRWTKDNWNVAIKAACLKVGFDAAITAYTFRHSVITDLVNGGLPILTVAQMSDTSVEMIERHYGHLNRAAAEQALASLAL